MALATIMVPPEGRYGAETFAFEHAVAHRDLFGAMASEQYGLSKYSVLPYRLDPSYHANGGWKYDHGQAHADFVETLPGYIDYWFFGFDIQIPTDQYLTLNTGNDFVDPDLTNPEQMNWWTFTNHQEHLIAESVIPLQQELIFPFW